MTRTTLAIASLVAAFVAAGCSKGDDNLATTKAPPPAPPSMISSKKAVNGGGAVTFIGGAPEGSGWKKGPPVVGQKANGGQ